MAKITDAHKPPLSIDQTAAQLRFVQRGDKRILQQYWKIFTTYDDGRTEGEYEWRDVPLVDGE